MSRTRSSYMIRMAFGPRGFETCTSSSSCFAFVEWIALADHLQPHRMLMRLPGGGPSIETLKVPIEVM